MPEKPYYANEAMTVLIKLATSLWPPLNLCNAMQPTHLYSANNNTFEEEALDQAVPAAYTVLLRLINAKLFIVFFFFTMPVVAVLIALWKPPNKKDACIAETRESQYCLMHKGLYIYSVYSYGTQDNVCILCTAFTLSLSSLLFLAYSYFEVGGTVQVENHRVASIFLPQSTLVLLVTE